MDPKILDLIIKLGSSGGLITIVAVLLYVVITQHNEMKDIQAARVADKDKCTEHLSDQTEKTHDVLDKMTTAIEKQNIQMENGFDNLSKDIATLKEHIKDLK